MSDVTEPADPFEITLAPPARRAITSKLPPDVAVAAVDFITGPLIDNPKRLGKREVLVVDIRHRADAYRRR
jgi:hypothetical protein